MKGNGGYDFLGKTQIWANIFICLQIVSIFIAFMAYRDSAIQSRNQMSLMIQSEMGKNALEAINKIYNPEFISAFQSINNKSTASNYEDVRNFSLVINNYYLVAIIYNSQTANNLMIQNALEEGIRLFVNYPIYRKMDSKEIRVAKNEIQQMLDSFSKK